jgi:tetratricopeptide (TPR) repeat protein
MDRNTVTGIILIFLIFLGFSVYNNQRMGKFFVAEKEYADSLYAAGNYEKARESYIRALNYKPKDQLTIDRVSELNRQLGLGNAQQQPSLQQQIQLPPVRQPCPGLLLTVRPSGCSAAGCQGRMSFTRLRMT